MNEIPIFGIFFSRSISINNIINNFLKARDNLMPEMHLRQPGFTYSSCGPQTKKKTRIQKLKKKNP